MIEMTLLCVSHDWDDIILDCADITDTIREYLKNSKILQNSPHHSELTQMTGIFFIDFSVFPKFLYHPIQDQTNA